MALPFLLKNNLRKRTYSHEKIDKDFKHAVLDKYGANYHLDAKKKILIFSTQIDTETDEMGVHFLSNGIDYNRINDNDIFEGFFSFTINYNDTAVQIILKDNRSNIEFNLDDYDYIWFRHFSIDMYSQKNMSTYEQIYYEQEWKAVISSIPQLYPNKVSMPSISDGFLLKPYQLKLAKEAGFNLIPTVISNDFNKVKYFSEQSDKNIVKAICHHMFFINNNNLVEFNTKNFAQLNNEDKKFISEVPAIYQPNYLNSDSKEIRVTVFGKRMIAYKYTNYFGKNWHSQLKELNVKKVDLPNNIQKSIQYFFEKAKITFGTVDFIIKDNCWYYLETNVNGDWAWLENLANTSFANLLISTLLEI